MDYLNSLGLVGFLILLKFLVDKFWKRHSVSPPFPPGPPPQILVGNYRDIPTKVPWLTYTEWGRRYGDIVHASALGEHVVIVNSLKTALELFEKRSNIYSDRDFNVAFLHYGDLWRQERRMFQQHFRPDMSREYRPMQLKKAHKFLRGLVTSPEEFRELTKTLAAAVIMSTVYGYEIKPANDRFVALSEFAVRSLSDSTLPGAAMVNTFPSLRYLPGWFPGCGFQYLAAECRDVLDEMKHAPFDFVKKHMSEDVVSKSVVGKMLDASEARGHTDELIQDVAAVAYAGIHRLHAVVYETHHLFKRNQTVSVLASFFLAMALHPDIQKRAQSEVDGITGTLRLPEFEDRLSLPFVEAVYREVLRWRPVLPLGVAHAASEDDVYQGYFIPKGTAVIPNTWAMTRDESIYPDAERFNPDRFFTEEGKLNDDDLVMAFGFGRRICPGRHVASATAWSAIVSLLATMNISKAKDETGKDIEIEEVGYSDGFICHPNTFPCLITPRSESAKNLINATALDEL
ncbi:cytochrome P450 [Mycena filopes]|nr:cytochrome P450 [Mycena filopes]